MICKQCGKFVPNDSRFCAGCGASVQIAVPVQTVPQNAAPVNTILTDSPYLAALKKLARSPLALIAILTFTASIVLNALSNIATSAQVAKLLNAFAHIFEDHELGIHLTVSSGDPVVSAITNAIPSILIALGLWITYFSAFKKKGMATVGLTIIKVLQIIGLVLICIGAGFAVLVMVIAIVFLGNAGDQLAGAMNGMGAGMENGIPMTVSDVMTVLITLTVMLAAIFTFVIVIQARIIGSINAASKVITTGVSTKKVSVFVAVLLIINGVSNAFNALSYMNMDVSMQQTIEIFVKEGLLPGEFVSILESFDYTALVLPQIVTAVATFLFGLLILNYRSKVQQLVVVPVAPVVPVAVPAAETPVVTESVVEEPVVEEPVVKEPVVEEPVAEEPIVEEPVVEEPVVEEPVVEEPVVEEPVVEEPVVEEPVVKEPVVEEPVVEEPVVEEPVMEEPVVEEPAVEEPAVEEAAVEEPAVEEAAVEEPVVEETVVEEPVAKEPAFVFCGECGQKLVPSAKFCSRCGHPQK